MAINYTISYSFSPNTTISSSQVNTNFSDNANTWTGLEALTKSFAKLKVDVDPATSNEVATKQYVDHYSTYRRPVLQWASISTVTIESGIAGVSGSISILFPDGSIRTENSATHTTFDITRNAVLTTSGAQGGLTGATSEANNTWYALYAVKVTDSTTQWVTVGSTVIPILANFSTLNTAYGTNGWVYLGMIKNGDQGGAISDIIKFVQTGNKSKFNVANTGGQLFNVPGILLATTVSATTLTYTYSSGTGSGNIPSHLTDTGWSVDFGSLGGGTGIARDSADSITYSSLGITSSTLVKFSSDPTLGIKLSNGGTARQYDIFLTEFMDGVLGVGSNPIL